LLTKLLKFLGVLLECLKIADYRMQETTVNIEEIKEKNVKVHIFNQSMKKNQLAVEKIIYLIIGLFVICVRDNLPSFDRNCCKELNQIKNINTYSFLLSFTHTHIKNSENLLFFHFSF